jgi:hypothetical protein
MGSVALTNHFSRFRYLIVVVLGVGSLGAAPAKEQAQKLVEAGNACFDASRWKEAIVAYQSALELYPSPRILVNLAEAQLRFGHWGDARANFQKFIDQGGAARGSRIHQSIMARIRDINDRSARLVITGVDEDAQLTIDSLPVRAAFGSPIVLAPGRHQVIVRAGGLPGKALTVTIEAGATLRLPVELEPPVSPAQQRILAPPIEPAAARVVPPIVDQIVEAPQAALPADLGIGAVPSPLIEESSVLEEWWFWTLIGTALAGAAAGTLAISARDGASPSSELGSSNIKDWP